MAVEKRTTDDGFDRATDTRVTLSKPGRATREEAEALRAALEEFARPLTLDTFIGAAEGFWRGVAAEPTPVPLSMAWYAKEILYDIEWLRGGVRDGVHPQNRELMIIRAVHLGAMIETARWKFGLGDFVKVGVKVRRGGDAGTKAARAQRIEEEKRLTDRLKAAAAEYRRRHPAHSARAMARYLGR